MAYTKKQLVSMMREQLSRRDVLQRAILRIYENQTKDEQALGTVNHSNGIGFTASDAPFLTSLAEWLNKGRTLTDRQAEFAEPKMKKYARQLVEGSIREGKIIMVSDGYVYAKNIKK